jgi:predicted nucleic acid-binding protein
MESLYIDSSVFISSLRKCENNHDNSKEFFKYVFANTNEYSFFTSYFTMLEVVCALKRREKRNSIKLFNLWLKKHAINITFIYPEKKKNPTISELMISFLPTVKKFSIRAMDTIHAHTIINHKIKIVISNDKHFNSLKTKGIEVLKPETFIKKLKKVN